jgi:hypothetical protein
MSNSISGSVGQSGVTIYWAGVGTNGTVTSTTGGAYTISGLANGLYTLVPVLAGYSFGPVALQETIASANITGANFTASAAANDQWAQSTLTAIAPNTATLSLTAVMGSGSTWTYAYTVSQGSVTNAVAGGYLCVKISGMQHSGNNGTFVATIFGSGTFTISNASGASESGSSGTGICPSDSGVGVCVRAAEATNLASQSCYWFHAGTNSYSGDGRVCYHELWKQSGGSGTILGGGTPANQTKPAIGDVVAVSAEGSTITGWYNAIPYTFATGGGAGYCIADTTLTTGSQGITTWSISGEQEYDFTLWNTTPFLSSSTPGNNGTQANDFVAGTITQSQLAADLFAYSNGDLHTANPNWAYEGTSAFQISSNVCYQGAGQNPGLAYRSDVTPNNDQYAQVICVVTTSYTTQNCGPAVRISSSAETAYICQFGSNYLAITKYVAGTATTLGTSTSYPVTGDVLRLIARGSSISLWKNGICAVAVTDSSITSGNIGIFGAGDHTDNGFSGWMGGNYTWTQTKTDTFSRANGALGDGWQGPYGSSSENAGCPMVNASINVVSDAYSGINTAGGDAYAIWNGGAPKSSGGGGGSTGYGVDISSSGIITTNPDGETNSNKTSIIGTNRGTRFIG